MRHFINSILITLAIPLVVSCTTDTIPKRVEQELLLNAVPDSSDLIETHFTYGNAHHFDSLGLAIFPLTFKNTPEGYASKTRFDEYSSYDSRPSGFWNLLFYELETGDSHLLKEEKIYIHFFKLPSSKSDQSSSSLQEDVLYQLSYQDYNEDGFLNHKDPKSLFSSTIFGKNLQQISPKGENLIDYEVLNDNDHILLKTIRDINQDKTFNDQDREVWYLCKKATNGWTRKELLSPDQINSLMTNLHENWFPEQE